ncbi:MAG: MmgE/PrpD family protein [Gammaproteobacteria bacterium]|nr:MAG: MmgE/PrpD family protein [Gammaproteobacteria bacterium]
MNPEQNISKILAQFSAKLDLNSVPDAVQKYALSLILDGTGIAYASSQYDFSKKGLEALRLFNEPGEHFVLGTGERMNFRDAALANGLLIHGLDFDDTHVAGVVHMTSAIWPCVLAVGEKTNATGKEMLAAYIVGMEVGARLGMVAKGAFHQVGHHPTGIAGAFACSLVAARLMKLTEEQMIMAQGIVLSMASGNFEFLEDGAWTKRYHPGWAAVSGIMAATFAKAGYIGPRKPYDGRFGLYKSHLIGLEPQCDYSLATAGLNEVWEVINVGVKPYPSCHFTHAVIDATRKLTEQYALTAEQIESITALVPEEVVKTVCEPLENKQAPTCAYEAQFSVPYLVAVALVRHDFSLDDLEPEPLSDPIVADLAKKVGYEVDPDSGFPTYYSGEIRITLKDGRTLQQREYKNRGCADSPLSLQEISDKFMKNCTMAVPEEKAQKIKAAILNLKEVKQAADLASSF